MGIDNTDAGIDSDFVNIESVTVEIKNFES